MIPNCGPAPTDSRAEQLVYHLLKGQLAEGFTIIHSLPWLSSAVREIAGVKAVTGEIDFLIVHSELGVLAIEVKGGAHKVQGLAFVHVNSGTTTRAVEQVRASTHGLAKWLGVNPDLRLKIGYALIFPDSDFNGQVASLALTDTTVDPPESIVIDRKGMPRIGQRIAEIMSYWKAALSNLPLGEERRKALIDTLCPSFDGTPSWGARVIWDEKVWLRLTPEQSAVVDDVVIGDRMVITGWPGTGKTLILIESAKRLLRDGKKVLVITFNALLAQFIRKQIGSHKALKVGTWHSLCGSVAARSQRGNERDTGWLERGCLEDINRAASRGEIQPFDAVLIDEAQTFRTEWIEWLCGWLSEGQLLAFCDETQVFAFEDGGVSLPKLCELIGVARPFALTTVLRSPRAVYQRLTSVKKSDYQLHMPRDLEADTLKEVLVVGMGESIARMLTMLAEKGVPSSDIVMLDKYGGMMNGDATPTVRHHTLSRFRGMESPIIIICSAEQMDDTELFCAYSRATTLCIALYDAEILGVRGADCLFQARVMAEPGHVGQAESARLRAQTGEIVRANLAPEWFGLESVKIGWLREWGAWIVVEQNALSSYWVDYLALNYPWHTYYWNEYSLREIHSALPVDSLVGGSPGGGSYKLRPCQECLIVTPQRLSPLSRDDVWQCEICARGEKMPSESPDDRMIEKLRALDALLMVENPKLLSEVERRSLPLPLAAGAALLFAERDVTRDLVGIDLVSGGRIAYHAAIGFVYSLVNLLPPGRNIKVADMAKELYGRYLISEGLTFEMWKRDFAQACSVAYKRGHLSKVEKGIYAPQRA